MINTISIRGAKEHNLKNINLDVPKGLFIVVTGLSGSGKSSLAFDTIHAEGKRRYLDSLSTFTKKFEMCNKPNVESITGLSPSIALDQRAISKNPRSTVATVAEIYDYMRILFARIGIPYSPATGLPLEKQTPEEIADRILKIEKGTYIQLLSPIVNGQKGEHRKELINLRRQGFKYVKVDNLLYSFDELSILEKNKPHTIEAYVGKFKIEDDIKTIILPQIESALRLGRGILHVEIVNSQADMSEPYSVSIETQLVFSEKFACTASDFNLTEIEPRIFSYNSPYGACSACDGIGVEAFFSKDLIIPNPSLSLVGGAIEPWSESSGKLNSISQLRLYQQTLKSLAKHYNFSIETPFEKLPAEIQELILYGSGNEVIDFHYTSDFKNTVSKAPFEGVIGCLEKLFCESDSSYLVEKLDSYRDVRQCTKCNGYRLKQESLCIKINGKNIGELCALSIKDIYDWFQDLPNYLNDTQKQIAEKLIKEIEQSLELLNNIGVSYLTLDRKSSTLSGGERQRIKLATQISSGLSGMIYVLDEPSIGLHQSDNVKLLQMIYNLRDLGNTVIVVEHDEETIQAADYIIDVGPGAGIYGGQIVCAGTAQKIIENPNSITGQYISGKLSIETPKTRRLQQNEKFIEIIGARANNLKNIDVKIPIGNFVVITGVSGSGKSTLIMDILYKVSARKLHNAQYVPGEHTNITGLGYLDKVIEVDQSPIGRTPRSNPATYINVFTIIREWFASLPEAKERGYTASRFSFNVRGGRCEVCEGDSMLKIEMYFLPDVYVTCEECKGQRYNADTLQIKYKGKSISEVLNMTAFDAAEFFKDVPNIHEKLVTLIEVGLGYIKIGQAATTLSGGEAQRVKLARELSKKSTGCTLYILDEPTTGLHTHDIKRLLAILNKFVDAGNTVVVTEHNLDVIKTADYIIDFGPQGGENGGFIVAQGRPEEIINSPDSITGKYLKKYLR